jgi:DNA (cytosine-5)-methyltransferase 1
MVKRENGKNISHQLVDIKDKLHSPRFHNPRDISIFKNWVSKNMNSMQSADKIKFYNDLIGKKSNHGKYRNLEWDKPSPTIVAHLHKDGLMFIHQLEKLPYSNLFLKTTNFLVAKEHAIK